MSQLDMIRSIPKQNFLDIKFRFEKLRFFFIGGNDESQDDLPYPAGLWVVSGLILAFKGFRLCIVDLGFKISA
jgi:hypothetical protein